MKNNYSRIVLESALIFAACISLWSQLTLANSTEDLTALVNLLDEQGISISTNPSTLLGEESVVVLSQGKLTDRKVHIYNDKYDGQLLALPLTIKLLDESVINGDEETAQERDKLFAMALTQGSMVYLYINPNHFKGSVNVLSDMLKPLLDGDFQDKLEDSRFAALPAEYIQQWSVSIGDVEPEYAGGYK